jgi:hypothetical protein
MEINIVFSLVTLNEITSSDTVMDYCENDFIDSNLKIMIDLLGNEATAKGIYEIGEDTKGTLYFKPNEFAEWKIVKHLKIVI